MCPHCKQRYTGTPGRCPLDGAALIDLPDAMIGKVIGGRYRIESKLGQGGMATVYKASHDVLGRKVAIKFLMPELASDPTQRERFLREARATNRIKHEHIVDISDCDQDDGLVYLVMEMLEGEPLASVIARGPLELRDALDYLIQTAEALARAHELEVVHRDLKPENIFLVPRAGRAHVKLLDFGLARVADGLDLTYKGSVFGTPEYMSPEQARGAPVGPAGDLYSLGIVLFEMLTARLPFEGSMAELIVKHLKATPPRPSSFRPELPPEFDALVARMLAKDPGERHRGAHHLIDELQALMARLPDPASVPRAEVSAPSPDLSRTVETTLTTREHPTAGVISVRAWIDRRAAYRRALDAAYGASGAPAWLAQTLERIDAMVDQATAVESEMQSVARELAAREAAVSDKRQQLGHALDVLTRDENGIMRQCEETERRLERARVRAAQSANEFARAWQEIAHAVPDGVLTSVDGALAVEAAARRATAWRQAFQEISENEPLLLWRQERRDDLRFQVSAVKGRLGAVNAESDHELGALRDRASELGAQMASLQESLAEAGATLAQHLLEFPAARPLIAPPGPSARR